MIHFKKALLLSIAAPFVLTQTIHGAVTVHQLEYSSTVPTASISIELTIDDSIFDEDFSLPIFPEPPLAGSGLSVVLTAIGTTNDGTFTDFTDFIWVTSVTDVDLSMDLVPQLADLNFIGPTFTASAPNEISGGGAAFTLVSTTPTIVPEPSSILLTLSSIGFLAMRRKRNK